MLLEVTFDLSPLRDWQVQRRCTSRGQHHEPESSLRRNDDPALRLTVEHDSRWTNGRDSELILRNREPVGKRWVRDRDARLDDRLRCDGTEGCALDCETCLLGDTVLDWSLEDA